MFNCGGWAELEKINRWRWRFKWLTGEMQLKSKRKWWGVLDVLKRVITALRDDFFFQEFQREETSGRLLFCCKMKETDETAIMDERNFKFFKYAAYANLSVSWKIMELLKCWCIYVKLCVISGINNIGLRHSFHLAPSSIRIPVDGWKNSAFRAASTRLIPLQNCNYIPRRRRHVTTLLSHTWKISI